MAFSLLSPRKSPPTMATPSRLMPASRARAWDAPMTAALSTPMRESSCSASSSMGTIRLSRAPLPTGLSGQSTASLLPTALPLAGQEDLRR